MAASIPEGTWIFIVILAVIILAILSNDSISRSGSSSRSGSGPSSDSRNPSGDSPRATTDDPDSSKNPIVKVTEANYDPDAERLRLKAEARSRSDAEIALTGFVMLSFAGDGFRAPNLQNSREVSSGRQHILETSLEIPEDKIDAGVVQYRAKTKDKEGRTGTQEGSFPLKAGVPDGSSDADGSGTPINIDVDYGGSDSGTGDDSGSHSSSDGEDSSTGGDDESGGDSDGSHLNDRGDNNSMADRGLLLGEDIKHLKQSESAVMRMEKIDEKEIEELEKLKKLLLTADRLVNQLKQDVATHAEAEGYQEILEIVADTETVLGEFRTELKQLEAYEEKFSSIDDQVENAISETSTHLDEELHAEIDKVDSSYPDKDISKELKSGSHGARDVSAVVGNVIDEDYP